VKNMPTGFEYETQIGQLIAFKQQNQPPGELDEAVKILSDYKRSITPPPRE
jgi:hypothetical protein